MASLLVEEYAIPYVLKPGDHQAGVVGDSINAGKLHRLTFIILFATLTGDAVLSIYSGASDGTKTTQETFGYKLGGAAQGSASADVYGARSTSSALTLTAATYQNKCLVVDIDAAALTDAQPWVTLDLDAAASALNAAIVAVCTPRYSGGVTNLTVLA